MPMETGGRRSLSAQDVWYHCLNTGLEWEAWERQVIVDMSKSYISGMQIGSDPFGIPPIELAENQES